MTDFALTLPSEIAADLIFEGDLLTDDGLRTQIIMSVHTDARASADDLARFGLKGENPRGWWGDSAAPVVANDRTGSLLWLLQRAKQTEETRRIAQDMIRTSLNWFIEDGIATSVEVVAQWLAPGILGWRAALTKIDGTRFDTEWQKSFIGAD